MAKVHISASRTTNKTIRAIDRKREQERHRMFVHANEHSEALAAKLVQRLIDRNIIETTSVDKMREVFNKQLKSVLHMEDFDLQLKVAPIRTLVPDPNFISLYLTQYIIEDLINHPDIMDIFGEDLDVYLGVDSVMKVLRPSESP